MRAALAVSMLAFAGCHRGAGDSDAAAAIHVQVQTTRLETFRDVVSAPGEVVPSPAGDWTISAPEPAQITELPKKENDVVAVDDLLVRLESPAATQDVAARQIAALAAASQLEQAKADAAREAGLFGRGLTPRNRFDASKSAQTAAEAALADADAQLTTAKAAEAQSVVKARFAGKVLKVWHAVGDTVRGGPGDPILRIVDPAHVQVMAHAPESAMTRVFPGQPVTIHAGGDAGQPGTLLMKLPAASGADTGDLRIAFAVPSTLELDTPVTVDLTLNERPNVILLPATAVLRDAAGAYVLIAGDDGRAHRRDVRLGAAARDVAQIAAGLSAGERVITAGMNDVMDGAPIAVGP